MKVSIDPSLCEGHKRCYNMYPTLFTEGPDGKGLVREDVDLESDDASFDAQSAANACPKVAIKIEY